MDAKTGAILASSTTPSFNPNKLNITNYENPLVSYAFEPGSTMKTYSYMCAIEKGTYEGTKTFESGIIKIEGGGTIKDWNTKGFGTISFDKGFEYSSNTGAVNLMRNFITKQELLDCYKNMVLVKRQVLNYQGNYLVKYHLIMIWKLRMLLLVKV